MYMPDFSAEDSADDYLDSPEWNDLIWKWESQVRRVVDTKGNPPALYESLSGDDRLLDLPITQAFKHSDKLLNI